MYLLPKPFQPAISFIFKDMVRSMLSEDKKPSMLINILSGGLAGALGSFPLYPLHYLRIRLAMDVGVSASQSEDSSKALEKQFKNARDCISKTRKQNGIRGLYKGFPVSILGIVVYRATYFGIFDTFKGYVKNNILMMWFFAQALTLT